MSNLAVNIEVVGKHIQTEVPFSKLFLSEKNMRKTPATKAEDNELRCSIKAHGLLQNLLVESESENGLNGVVGGGRRYTQLSELVKSGEIDKNELVKVLILADGTSSKEVSLIENSHRVDSHPVDDYECYVELIENEGFNVSQLSRRFGVSKRYIEQRVLLGNAAPTLRALAKAGKLGGGIDEGVKLLEAFTVSKDHAKQMEVYEALRNQPYRFNPKAVRSALTDSDLSSDSKLVKYVGLAAYKKAGGTCYSDLFENKTFLSDSGLLVSLADKKMESYVENYSGDWSWVEYDAGFDSWKVQNFEVIRTEIRNAPKKLLAEIELKKARYIELENMDGDSDEWTGAVEKEWYAIDGVIDALEGKMDDYKVFVEGEKAFAGVVLTISDSGEVIAYKGLVKPEDSSKLELFRNAGEKEELAPVCNEEGDISEKSISLYSDVMTRDIGAFRKSIAKVAIIGNTALGNDLAMFSLCFSVFSERRWSSVCDVNVSSTVEDSSKNDISESKAQKTLDDFGAEVDRGWLRDNKLESFKLFRELASKTKKDLCSYCAAISFKSNGIDEQEIEFSNYLLSESKINPADYFRPTAENFFKRVSKNYFNDITSDLMGEKWLNDNKTQKRIVISKSLEDAVNGVESSSDKERVFLINWMPRGM